MSYSHEATITASPSEQDFVDMLSRAQCRRYDSQRSPFPSPVITRATPEPDESCEDEENVDTPTNPRHMLLTEEGGNLDNDSLHSSSISSDESSPAHLLPPPASPAIGLRPNRRSVEALKKLIQTDDAPFPLIITPPDGGYWVQNGEYESSRSEDGAYHAPEIDTEHFRLETDSISLMYGRHFVGRSHKNYYVRESKFGPLVFSLMIDSDVNCDPLIRMLLRTREKTHYKVYPSAQLSRKLEPEEYLGIILATLNNGEPLRVDGLTRIHSKKAPEILQKFDEHSVAKQHKIGVIYQRYGQATEEEMFCNNEHSPAFKEFLELLGETVKLKGFQKYRGGLDNRNNQTGEYSVYTEFKGQEIMFHVSTLLPYDPGDRQQVARKRHIGNDIVLIVFQDQNTPYSPDCVRSRFLHAHIAVQVEQKNTQNTVYKVAVAAKEDVPDFSPPLPTPAVFAKDNDFREWLLTKVLNAEAKCHQAQAFLNLATRTRTQLFTHLLKELSGSKEDIDTPSHDKRKSLGADIYDQQMGHSSSSPKTRRKTFGTLFPSRRKMSGQSSPKMSRTKNSPDRRAILATSTPDLSIIGEEPNERNDDSHRHRISVAEIKSSSSGKRRFTLRNKRRPKQSLTTDILQERQYQEPYYRQKSNPQYQPIGGFSSDTSSMASNLTWSVPSDLPGIVTQVPSGLSANPSSLENLTFSLDPLHRERCSSNPDIAPTRRRRGQEGADFVSPPTILDVVRSPSSARPQSCDVGVQVDSRRQIFTFPTPPQSVSPTEYPGYIAKKGVSTRVRLLESQQVDVMAGYNSASNSSSLNDNIRHSFPFVPEEEEEMRHPAPSVAADMSTPGQYDSDDSSESPDEIISDTATYNSLLISLRSLTAEVSRLREQQLHLYHQNAKLATKAKKWKTKYKSIKQQLNESTKDQPISQRRSSEIGTTL